MIQIEHLSKSFAAQDTTQSWKKTLSLKSLSFKSTPQNRVQAVRDVNLTAPDGVITGLLGPNGAGKTTTLRMLAGLIQPDGGRMTVDGLDVATQTQAAVARMGLLSDSRGLYPRLTARENIVYFGQLQGMTSDEANVRATAACV